MAEVVDVLTKARERVAKGWCQKVCARDRRGYAINSGPLLRNPSKAKSVCIVAALAIASPDWWKDQSACEPLVEVLGLDRPNDLIEWNNAPGRTQKQVLKALDKAIKKVA